MLKPTQLFTGALLLIGCLTGAAVRELVAPARAQGSGAGSYQYTTLDMQASGLLDGSQQERDTALNRYGRDGWRIVGVIKNRIIFEKVTSGPSAH